MDKGALERHVKQNREIIKINQVQASRIASLETEITKLLSENIQLRSQVIQLQHRTDITQQKAQLERKVKDLHRLVKALGSAPPVSPQIIRKSPKKCNLSSVSPTTAAPTFLFSDPDIDDRKSRKSRRMSHSLDQIPIPRSPNAEPEEPIPLIVEEVEKRQPLQSITNIKHEPSTPKLEGRTKKVVSYAEPSLRVKMRRTESLPGDKRRRSSTPRMPS